MNLPKEFILQRIISIYTIEKLCSLLEKLLSIEGPKGILLTNSIFTLEENPSISLDLKTFYLFLSPKFSILLQGVLDTSSLSYQVTITTKPKDINNFVQKLYIHLNDSSVWKKKIVPYLKINHIQSTNLLQYLNNNLRDILEPKKNNNLCTIDQNLLVTSPLKKEIEGQLRAERLLSQVISKIRQSLDIPTILENTVKASRESLGADRLIVYKFNNKQLITSKDYDLIKGNGYVVHESLATRDIPSLLKILIESKVFTKIAKYQKRSITFEADINNYSFIHSCFYHLPSKFWILSEIVAPIKINDNLWGLLVAHQCLQKRRWLSDGKVTLEKIAEHLAVALYQAQLYSQVQKEKYVLKQKVIKRTQELCDTLVASQAANYSKSEFLGNMSHELRTPLTCIIGLSGTLLYWSKENSTLSLEKRKHYLATIQNSGENLLQIINEILEYSNLQTGKCLLNIQEFSLSDIAKNILQKVYKEEVHRHINLKLDLRINSIEDTFLADPVKMKHILYYLLNNALKFTPENGTVILRVWRHREEVVWQVEDTGIGIKTEQIPLLFKLFQKLENHRKRVYGGTGLGLALTKQLVELHSGTIEVDSLVNKGSIFTIRIPNQSQFKNRSNNKLISRKESLFSTRVIILIESNNKIATLLEKLLTSANYYFIWLINDIKLIRKIELIQPIAIILDQDLSKALKISKLLKKSSETKSIKVLFLKDTITSKEWLEIAETGIDDYLIKPIQSNFLLKRIKTLTLNSENINFNT